MTNSNIEHGTFLKSAFKIVYLGAFGMAIYQICSHAENFKVLGQNNLDNRIFSWLNIGFIWILGFFHNLRLYITLEMLEDEDFIFENFFVNANKFQRFLEFICRVVIVSVVSLKIYRWSGSEDLSQYMLYLYSALFVWGVVVGTFDFKNWKHWLKNTYLPISIFGLGFALSMRIMVNLKLNESVAAWSIFTFILVIFLIVDIVIDYRKNHSQYKLYGKTFIKDFFNLGN